MDRPIYNAKIGVMDREDKKEVRKEVRKGV